MERIGDAGAVYRVGDTDTESLLALAPDPVLLLMPDGTVVNANHAAAAGHFKLGQPAPLVSLDAARPLTKVLPSLRRSGTVQLPVRHLSNGLDYHLRLAPAGAGCAWAWLTRPQGEGTDEPLTALFETSNAFTVMLDSEGRILFLSRTGATMLGAESPEAFIGRPLTDLYEPEYHEQARERMQQAMDEWRPLPLAERRLRRVDGSIVEVEVAAIPFLLGGRPATHVVFMDISERKQNERELQRYRERLQDLVTQRTTELVALNQELEAFSHAVSHDLRAPLRAINGFSSALLEDYTELVEGEPRRYLERIRANTARMADIIDNLRELSRVASHQMRYEPVDLGELARAVVDELHTAEPDRQITVEVPPQLPSIGDPTLLQVVLQNLIGNAWKYTATRERAQISVGGSEGVYWVRDNGIGFDAANAEELFIAFRRLHSQQEFEGSGIGLATVKRIIHRHGGSVWAESGEGKGATFFFSLPRVNGD